MTEESGCFSREFESMEEMSRGRRCIARVPIVKVTRH